jgi:hypothetical protein
MPRLIEFAELLTILAFFIGVASFLINKYDKKKKK